MIRDISWCYRKHTKGLHNTKILCSPSGKRKREGEVHQLSHLFYSIIAVLALLTGHTQHMESSVRGMLHMYVISAEGCLDKRLRGERKREAGERRGRRRVWLRISDPEVNVKRDESGVDSASRCSAFARAIIATAAVIVVNINILIIIIIIIINVIAVIIVTCNIRVLPCGGKGRGGFGYVFLITEETAIPRRRRCTYAYAYGGVRIYLP